MNKAINDLVRGFKLYPVWLYQAYYELTAKYKRTIFGSLWIASNMVASSLAISILWSAIFGADVRHHLAIKMAGQLCGSTALFILYEAPELFMSAGSVIKNHAYPFTYFVFEQVANKMMLFFHNLVVFYVFMIVLGGARIPNWTIIIGLPMLIVSLFLWGNIVGMLSARFRDLRFMLPSIGYMVYFLTPIYWDYDQLKTNRWIADLNPFYALVDIVRMPLMGQMPTDKNWIMALCVIAVGLVVWFISFSAFRRKIPFWV